MLRIIRGYRVQFSLRLLFAIITWYAVLVLTYKIGCWIMRPREDWHYAVVCLWAMPVSMHLIRGWSLLKANYRLRHPAVCRAVERDDD